MDDLPKELNFPPERSRSLVVTVDLTPDQSDLLFRCSGQRLERLELSAQDLDFVAGGHLRNPAESDS